MLRTFHPCAFNFQTTNIRRVGNTTDGGTSLSGISEQIEADGGGYLQADFSDGSTRDKLTGNAWRAISDLDAGEAVIVMLCAERLYQPVGKFIRSAQRDAPPFDFNAFTPNPGAAYAVAADAALRATTLTLAGTSELALVGGELFSILHPTWGWRAYRVRSVSGGTITFRSPLREAVTAGTLVEFDYPRCQMRVAKTFDNTTSLGRFTACAASFVEDMREPS